MRRLSVAERFRQGTRTKRLVDDTVWGLSGAQLQCNVSTLIIRLHLHDLDTLQLRENEGDESRENNLIPEKTCTLSQKHSILWNDAEKISAEGPEVLENPLATRATTESQTLRTVRGYRTPHLSQSGSIPHFSAITPVRTEPRGSVGAALEGKQANSAKTT